MTNPTYKKYLCRQINHYTQRKKPYTVHVVQETKDCYEVYVQKDGYPMLYAFGVDVSDNPLDEVFAYGWNYIYKNGQGEELFQ